MAHTYYIVTADVPVDNGRFSPDYIEQEFTIDAKSKQQAAKIVRDTYGAKNIKVDFPSGWEQDTKYVLHSGDLDYEPSYIFDDED